MTQQEATKLDSSKSSSLPNWKNVNNWHWVDKNCLPWAQKYLSEKFISTDMQSIPLNIGQNLKLKVKSMPKCQGDVDLNLRKSKLIYLFDLNIDLDWEVVKLQDSIAKGTLSLEDCQFDEEPEDYKYSTSFEFETDAIPGLDRDVIIRTFKPLVDSIFRQFPKDLVESNKASLYAGAPENSKLSSASNSQITSKNSSKPATSVTQANTSTHSNPEKSTKAGDSTTSIKYQTYFKCSKQDLLDSLLNEQRTAAWTQGQGIKYTDADGDLLKKAEQKLINNKQASDFNAGTYAHLIGKKFEMINGRVSGLISSIRVGFTSDDGTSDEVVMLWNIADWKSSDKFSLVRIKLTQLEDSTRLELRQSNIPVPKPNVSESEAKQQTLNLWQGMYFERIKRTFGFAVHM